MKKIFAFYEDALQKCKGKNVGDFMSMKLKELNGMSAEAILERSGQLEFGIVDLEKIINDLDISIYPRTFDDIEEIKKTEVAGLVLLNGDDIGIFYDIEAPIERKRFIIAHELGHCCLHGEILKDGYIEFLRKNGFEDEHETEASAFAARLLIPKKLLINVYNKLLIPSLDGLAEIFQVPKHLMEYRLKELRLEYYIIKGDRFVKSK